MTPTFQGEVQFRRWSDSSTQGVQVTFALPDSADLEPLKHKAGKRFMAVLVEIGDDEQPVQPEPKRAQRGPLCREACDLCELGDFMSWASVRSEQDAATTIKMLCGVESRKELDTDAAAAEKFRSLVRVPFMKWQRERRERGVAQ
jgi:hypothetical protein